MPGVMCRNCSAWRRVGSSIAALVLFLPDASRNSGRLPIQPWSITPISMIPA